MFGLGCTYFESHVLKKVKSTDDVDIGGEDVLAIRVIVIILFYHDS